MKTYLRDRMVRIITKRLGRRRIGSKNRVQLMGEYVSPATIYIDSRVQGFDLLDTLIHEMTHASFPDLREEVVDQFATQVAGGLSRYYKEHPICPPKR
jgi:hypothetical protein